MSYILDALRKSEQERLRGQLPTLNHFGEEDSVRRSPHRIWWIVGIVLVVLNSTAIAVWLWREHPGSQAVTAQISGDGKAEAAGKDSAATIPPAVTGAPGSVTASGETPNASAVTPQVAGTANGSATSALPAGVIASAPPGTVYYVTPGAPVAGQQIIVVPAGAAVSGVPGAVAVPGGGVAGVGNPVANPGVPVSGMATAGNVVIMPSQPDASWSQSVQPPPPAPPPPPPVNLDQALDATGVSAAMTPTVSYLPQLDELPDYLRAQIPDMAFSSHMYSSMPRFRSVVINGNRVKEGQMLGNNLQVNEITETGVILSLGGTLFQVDVLGKWSQ